MTETTEYPCRACGGWHSTYTELCRCWEGAKGIRNSYDIDKLVGAVIDAYTLTPNDEDEKREAVKAAIIRSGWIQDVSYA